ncbi:MAG: ATP synthase delta/epsilon chain alpha-helix domain-containing protein, partial [Sulfobacillus sp.]
SGGFLEVRAEQVTVLARTAEWAGDIDQERAQSALMRAEEHLADSGADRQRARFAKRRAEARLQAAHAHQAVVGRLAHGASAG